MNLNDPFHNSYDLSSSVTTSLLENTESSLSTRANIQSKNKNTIDQTRDCYTQSNRVEGVVILLENDKSASASSLFRQIQIDTRLSIKRCSSVQELDEYIKEVKEQPITIVTTSSKDVIQLLTIWDEQRAQLKGIYVLDPSTQDMVNDRRIGYFSNATNLLNQIESDTQPSFNQEPILFNCFDRGQTTMRDLNKERASFMWTHILLDVLKQIPTHETAMEEMLHMCAEHYRDNGVQLNCIKQFRDTYVSHHAIQWYTKNCFLYRLLNQSLRTEDTDALYLFRTFVIDLCAQLEEKKHLYPYRSPVFTVYRGQMMYEWELKKMKANIGHLVSSNSFLSASWEEEVARVFAGSELTDLQKKSVLLQIEVDTRLKYTTVVPIAHLSEVSEEAEVLFSLLTVFKILNVCEEPDNNCWRIYLQTTDEGREVIDEYKHFSLMDDECPTQEILFGRLLMYMGQDAKALKYFTSLDSRLNAAHTDDAVLRAAIICAQSESLYFMGRYEDSKECSKRGLTLLNELGMSATSTLYLRCRHHLAYTMLLTNEIPQAREILEETLREQQKRLSEDHVHIGDTLKTIGLMIGYESGYDKALQVRQEALRIYEKALPENHLKRILAITSLAGSYEALGKFHVALDYLNHALNLQKRYLPDEHSTLAVILRSIGVMYHALDELDTAFDYYCQAYSIWMFLYPHGHSYTVFCLNRIGRIYCDRKQFSEALECQMHALEMRTKLFKKGTPQLYVHLGRTYLAMGDNVKAIEALHLDRYYWKAKTTNPALKSLNVSDSLLATAYSHNGEFDKAQQMFERVLSLQKSAQPEGNVDIGYTLHHLGSNLMRMNKYNRAKQCYEESLSILLRFFPENHHHILTIREKMANLEAVVKKMEQD